MMQWTSKARCNGVEPVDGMYCVDDKQWQLNSLKVVGVQLTSKTHFYCKKLNTYKFSRGKWPQYTLILPPMMIRKNGK